MANAAHMLDSQPELDDEVQERFNGIAHDASLWEVVHQPTGPCSFSSRIRAARRALRQLEKDLAAVTGTGATGDPKLTSLRAAFQELRSNPRVLRTALLAVSSNPKSVATLPRVIHPGGQQGLRVALIASSYLSAVDGEFSAATFRALIETLQEHEPLTLGELWNITAFLRFVLVELLLEELRSLMQAPDSFPDSTFSIHMKSLRALANADLASLIESLIAFDALLRQDPAQSYERMDFESRELYRNRVAFIARHSDCTESTVAQTALDMARAAEDHLSDDARVQQRVKHVGYYLVDKGFPMLAERVGFHPPPGYRVRQFVRRHGEDFYITGIQIITILFLAAVLFPLLPHVHSVAGFVLALIVSLLPVTQDSVELVNRAVTAFFEPEMLPKLDFSKGIPLDCTTLVTVPALLLNENQVRELVDGLEVRFLANPGPNLHFALVTDLPDSVHKPRENDSHPLVELAVRLIGQLNARYGPSRGGSFLLLHRHRIFNTRQGVWMGWERKRGKLLDLNKLLTGEFDAFPVKVGRVDVLCQVRYILTLDSDTELPRDAAARLAGAIAHPLNKAIVDPKLRIVTSGYGILQPRVGVSVRSTAGSRLAAIFSGQNGFDIYTRAISDAYQDLFGEGTFTGKGIYEVETFHTVLDRRFPRNALLSHDLIEGAYARAGLTTDIELIDDYPSHMSAYRRRKHRWVRGDWQIAQWMFSRVPNEQGRTVNNPISNISRWKIFDNLRRSLVDPFLFLLFIAGWLVLPGGPVYWTAVSLLLFILPVFIGLIFDLGRAAVEGQRGRTSEVASEFCHATLVSVLRLVMLPYETILAVDAVFRALVRRFVTGERLLEWETAAQVELQVDTRVHGGWYRIVIPTAAAGLGALVWFFGERPYALLCAAPILLLWAMADIVARWLDRPPQKTQRLPAADEDFLRGHAILIWRYFQEFSSERHNYLIPDNVEEGELFEAARVSPTNIGLLLNARQAACELGLLTVPEFANLTSRTLATVARLEKFRGHLYNWYNTETLRPLDANPFVSTVDSGNFVASLYTLSAGARELSKAPFLPARLFAGLRLCWRMMLAESHSPSGLADLQVPSASAPTEVWIDWLPEAEAALTAATASEGRGTWLICEVQRRIENIRLLLRDYLPWVQPEFEPLSALPGFTIDEKADALSITGAIFFAEVLEIRITHATAALPSDSPLLHLATQLKSSLHAAVLHLQSLATQLQGIAEYAERIAEETEFDFLVDPARQIMSIGFNMGSHQLHEACYDMLASEARIATFLAIARGDLPHQSWAKLSRDHAYAYGRFLLLSWTGTMFEYMMPALWMRSYSGTLLALTQDGCVRVQYEFARTLGIPWGISESGSSLKDDAGHYHYQAYGVPRIALWFEASPGPVISPYSSFLALAADAPKAIRNLRSMDTKGWAGAYGFYESADYTNSLRAPALTREWMAHHQGMSLLAITNLLHNNAMQRWFHQNPLVRSTELILHETPPSKGVLKARLREVAPLQVD